MDPASDEECFQSCHAHLGEVPDSDWMSRLLISRQEKMPIIAEQGAFMMIEMW